MTKFMKSKYIALLLVAGTLGACGSSSGGNNSIPIDLNTPNAITATSLSLLAATGDETTRVLNSAIPSSGASNYNGIIFIDTLPAPLTPVPAYVGETIINVSYAGSTSVTGTADNFVYVGGPEGLNDPLTSLAGSLEITNGLIDRTVAETGEDQFTADLNGKLIIPSSITGTGSPRDADIDGSIDGFFVVGGLIANIEGSRTEGGATVDVKGGIIAVEN